MTSICTPQKKVEQRNKHIQNEVIYFLNTMSLNEKRRVEGSHCAHTVVPFLRRYSEQSVLETLFVQDEHFVISNIKHSVRIKHCVLYCSAGYSKLSNIIRTCLAFSSECQPHNYAVVLSVARGFLDCVHSTMS